MSEWTKSVEEAPPRSGVPIDFIIKPKNSTCLKRYTDCHPLLETDWLTSTGLSVYYIGTPTHWMYPPAMPKD